LPEAAIPVGTNKMLAKGFKSSWVQWYTSMAPATQEAEVGPTRCQASLGKASVSLSEKHTKSKRTRGEVQMVACLLSKQALLNSNPRVKNK
jgi:hypothetical protein